MTISRRKMLTSTATMAAGGAIAAGLRSPASAMPPDVPDSMRSQGQPILSPLTAYPPNSKRTLFVGYERRARPTLKRLA